MCSGTWNTRKQWPSPVVFIRKQQQQQQQKKKKKKKKKKSWPHVSVTLRRNRSRLIRRRRELRSAAGAEMAMLNLKLRLENRRIVAENERLRERASALCRENLLLRANLCKTVAEAAPQEEVAPGC